MYIVQYLYLLCLWRKFAGLGADVPLLDDLESDPVKVREPEGEPHLPTGPCTQHFAHCVPGGQLGG